MKKFIETSILAFATMLIAAAFAAPAHAETFSTYVTPNQPEAVAAVPVNNTKVVIISLSIGDVQKGDIIVLAGEAELTNNSSQWALFTRSMILASDPAGTTGTAVTETNGENFNPSGCFLDFLFRCDVHHLVASKTGILVAPAAIANGYVNLIALASTDPAASGSLTVEKGYGRISVLKIRP